jgi:hypothetical protein
VRRGKATETGDTGVDSIMSHRHSRRRPPLSSALPSDIFPTTDEITSRAQALFVARGRDASCIAECRLEAEQELLEQSARRLIRPLIEKTTLRRGRS